MIPIKNTLSRLLANFMSFLMITTNVIVPTYSLSSAAAVTIVSNPDLQPGCGIKVALVLDASGSIDSTEQNQLRSAVNGFITALQGSGSKIAIVEFGTNADTPVPYTEDTTANASVFSNYLSTSNRPGPQYHDGRNSIGSATNWEAGMRQVNALPTPPDLVVVVTDGVPNARGVPGITNQSQQVAADAAALEANITKLNAGNGGAGSHILTIGVGMQSQDLPYMFQLTDGAASTVYAGTNFATADHVNSSSFGNLLSDLTNISAKLCNSSVTVTKMVDETGAGSYAPAANWNFTANVTTSAGTYTWVSPTQGAAGPMQGTTGADGQLFYQWNPSNVSALSTVQIGETQQPGYQFVDVTCTLNGQPITVAQSETFTISNIPLKGFANCVVRNKKSAGSITIVKNASPTDSTSFAFTAIGSGVSNFSLVPNGSNSKTFSGLGNGNYSFTEAITSGWSLATLSCNGGNNISTSVASRTATIGLSAGENVVCTFGNVKNGTIIVKKVTNPSGRPQSFTFTGNVAGSISDGQTIVVNNVKPGQYTSTEAAAANFNLSSIVCDDSASATPSTGDINSRTATFNVDAGETITCTFTNTLVQQAAAISNTIHSSSHNAITSGLPGITVHDSAVVTGGNLGTPTGNVTFTFFNNGTCSGAPVATSSAQALNASGSVDATAFPQGPLNAGNYSFQARYNGDVNYTPVTSACAPLVINQNDVSLSTQLKLASDNSNLGAQISTGTTIYNTAALSGTTPSAGGSVTYTTYVDSNCSVVDPTHSASTVSVTNGIVPNSSNGTFNSAGTFYFKATYSGDTNNKAATSACTSVQVVAPNLALTNVADSASVIPGSSIGYVITVTNNGQGSATNTTMTGNLPQASGFNWTIDLAQSDAGCSIALDTLSCNFGNMAPGASKHVHVTTTTTTGQAMCGSHDNYASAQANNNAQVSVGPVGIAINCSQALSLSKSALPTSYATKDQSIIYTYTIRNSGNVDIGPSQFTVSDDKINNGAAFNCGAANTMLAPNATVTCTHTYAITQADLDAGFVTNTATATAPGAPTTAPAQATITATQTKRLSIAKSVPAQQMTYDTLGQQITYNYIVTNVGNVTVGPSQFMVSDDKINGGASFNCGPVTTLAPNATVSCSALYTITQADLDAGSVTNRAVASGGGTIPSTPAEVTITANQNPSMSLDKTTTATGYNAVGNVLSYDYLLTNTGNVTLSGPFNVGDDRTQVSCPNTATLAPGQSIHCGATYGIKQSDIDAGSVTNIASGEASFNLLPVVSNTDSVIVSAQQTRELGVTKSAFPVTYSTLNQTITYTYVIKNTGNVTLGPDQFKVRDDKINGGSDFNCGAASTTLAPNATVTCTHDYSITQDDLDAGSVTNTATASGAGVGPSAPAQATITAMRGPALSLDKQTSTASYQAVGDVLSYSYVLVNSGNVTLSGPFTVADDKTSVTCPNTATLAPTQSITCSATYVVTQDDLDVGSVTNHATGHSSFNNAPVNSNPDSVTITAQQESRLSIAKSVAPEQMTYSALGEQITYSYVVTNVGNISVGPTQFTVSDNRINNGAAFNCGAPVKLLPGATVSCSAVYSITQADLDSGSVTNIATGSGGGVGPSTPAQVTINAVQNPGLALDKSSSTSSYSAVGDVLSYSYLLTNTGNVTLSGPFLVSDDKTAVSCPSAATLAPSASITCSATYNVTQADLDAGSVTNNASGQASFNNAPVNSNPDTVTVNATQDRGLSIQKSASQMSYDRAGQVITYTYIVRNTGNVTLGPDQFVVNDDRINNGAAFNCGAANTTLAPNATLTCTHDYTITLADMDAGSVTNKATAAGAGVGPSPEASVTINAIKQPALSIGKSASSMTYNQVGQIITYTYVITNSGNVTVGPDQLTVSDDKINNGAPFACPQGSSTLAPQQTATCSHDYVITQADLDAGSVTNYATASGGGVGPSAPANVTITAEQSPSLDLDKASETQTYTSVGDAITYTYVLTNTGNVTLSGPFNVGDDRTQVSCPNTASLAPAQSTLCGATYVVTQADIDAGSVTNIASGEASFNLLAVVSNSDSVTVSAQQTRELGITKSAFPTTYGTLNQTITYTYVIKNTGNVTLGPDQFKVRDDKINGGSDFNCGAASTTLAPNATVNCTHTYSITQDDLDAGSVTNTATASGAGVGPSAPAQATITAMRGPALSLDKQTSTASYQAVGDVLSYSYVLVNSGNVTLSGPFTVADDKTSVTCPNTATLAPTQSITCSANYLVTQDDLDAGAVTNIASAAASFNNTPVASNTDSVTITAQQESRLSIAKSVAPEQMTYSALGEQISYSYVVTNVGNISVGPTQFTVSDNRINNGAAFNCGAPVKLLPGATVSCSAVYSITQADLDSGSVTNIATGSGGGVGPSLPAQVTIQAAQNPSLALDKSSSTSSYASVGDVLTYSYLLTNTGNVTLSGPFLVSDDKTAVSCPSAATLAPSASITCSATYNVTQADLDAGSVTNNASGQASFNNAPVNSNPDSVTINATQEKGLGIQKSASQMSYDHAGQVITYTYVIKNTGNVTLGPDQFKVSDDRIDNGAAFDCGPATATLAPQATLTCTHDYAITLADMDAGSVTNKATAAGAGVGPSPEASVTINAIKQPALSIGKSASSMAYNHVGQVITYTYVITNSGNVTVGPGQFTVSDDKIDNGTDFNCGAPNTMLAPQETATCSHDYVITQADLDAGSVTNHATASGGGVGPSAPAQVTIMAEQSPSLALDKASETQTYAAVGDVITYTYLLTNTGNVTLSGPFNVGDDRTTVSCPSTSTLAPAQSTLCGATYVVTQADIDAGSVTNIASGEAQFNLLPVVSNPDSVTVNATQTKLLSLTKTDDLNPGTYNHVGQVINFTITATNMGNVTLRKVDVTDDPALDNYSCTPSIPAATLAPGSSIVCKGSYSITDNDLMVGEVTDVATATSDDLSEPVTATDTLFVGLGKLTLIDETIADNGGDLTAASWTMTASGTSMISGKGTVTGHVIDGNYALSQDVAAGFASSVRCTDANGNAVNNGNMVPVSVGANITCVFHNDDIAPRLKLIKLVTNTHRRTATPDDWRLNAIGARVDATNLSGQTPVQSGANFKADVYALSETGPQHYTSTGISCVDDNNNPVVISNGNQIRLALGQNATCTFSSVDNIIPNLIVDPGCNCDATGNGTPSASNFLMMGLMLFLSMMWRRRRKMD